MRINRIETKAYDISGEAEDSALKDFRRKAREIEKSTKEKVLVNIEHRYTPILVVSAVKKDMEGMGTLIHGMENRFHVGLNDGCIYVLADKSYRETAKEVLIRSPGIKLERIDILMDLATLPPQALQTLGYLLDHGTLNFMNLDRPKQDAVKELQGRKYADVYRPEDRESDITSVVKEIFNFHRVTPLYKVKAMLPAPRFTHHSYDISSGLRLTDLVEDDVSLESIVHAPEKIIYILGTLFNCSLRVERIVYLPYVECTFKWGGKQSAEIRHVPCLKTSKPRKYLEPVKLKTITLGTKGHGLDATPVEDVAITFDNVAGMEGVKERIREAIIHPLQHPELSEEFGREAGGGVLLYGPPGCGKTYIMRATVGESGVNFFSVSVQDIVGEDIEAGARRLDEVFNEAREGAPSILFFDEIDALGGRRSGSKGGGERRIINQFLTNMEGLGASNRGVLVTGSTNAPWDLDPALRRAGRLTTQIFIPPPDYEARLELFRIHTKGRPIEADVDFRRLAELTENYSSADVTAVCDEAAKIPWSESVRGGERRGISMGDFLTVLNERDSTLTPWLRLAEKQLRESGESELFPDLSDYVFKRAGGIEMIQQPNIDFSDVGDLTEVKEEIKNKVVYPIQHPGLSEEYGHKAGGGILLYGPPGCGKTYIARATAGECEASFFNVKITDLLSPEQGVTEKRLHSIFERASRNTPAVIFFDEVDAVAGQRSSSKGGAERRLINQFLAEMDGFEAVEGVVVLAATNAPWDIDPALRRAGRFSDQIFVPPPDLEGREEIFKIHIDGRPVDDSVNFRKLAESTEGYSSADIKLICDEAAKIPWKESMESGEKRPISMEDFKKVLSERKPSITPWLKQAEKQLRESGESELYTGLSEYVFKRAGGVEAVEKPELDFNAVGGLEDVKEAIRNKVVYPLENPKLAREYGRQVGGGILLYGPPGCGKTYIARATAGEANSSFFNVKITDLLSPDEGETERRLHSIFERASRNTPAVIFFDEVDAVAGQRSSSKGGAERRLINQFLAEMDGFEAVEGVVVLAATNAPWDIDPALRRAGRFSDQIFVPPPDLGGREEIFKIHAAHLPGSNSLDYEALAMLTEGYSSADIKLICDEAAKIPWKESLKSGDARPVSVEDFKQVLSQRKPSISAWFVQARQELENSDERTLYPELWSMVQGSGPGADELQRRKRGLEKKINIAREKYHRRQIDEQTFKEIVTEYEKQLIELEAQLGDDGQGA